MNALGVIVRDARRRKGLSQVQLAERAGVSDRTIRDIELGKTVKSARRHAQTFKWLAAALDLPVELVLSLAGFDAQGSTSGRSRTSAPTMESFLGDLARLQGMPADVETAHGMRERQDAVLRALLWKADEEQLSPLWSCPMRGIESAGGNRATERLAEHVKRILGHVHRFRVEMAAAVDGAVEKQIVEMLERLRGEWGRVPYDAGIDDALFAEYILGLAYFEVTSHLARTVELACPLADYVSIAGAFDGSSYAAGLEGAFMLHECAVARINAIYDGPGDENGWLELLGAIFKSERRCASIRDELKLAVSLRCVSSSLPETATMAQLHHWDGWGGDGRVLEGLGEGLRRSRNDLLQVLHRSHTHAFDWHCLRDGDRRPVAHFASKQPHLRDAARSLGRYSAACSAALLSHPALRGSRDAVFLWGDAVGPTAFAERGIVEKVRRIRSARGEGQVRVWSVLTEASASSVALLSDFDLRPDPRPRILWRDLNKSFPGEPGAAIPERWRGDLEPGRYDCYSCSVALHHVADRTTGRRRIQQIFAFATRLVRSGGVISLPDVAPGAYMQAYLLPTNLIDREGGWGSATFFDETGFKDVACTLCGRFLGCCWDAGPEEVCKIPVPLLGLRRGTPRVLDAAKACIFEYVPYVVIDVDLARLTRFDDDWRRATSPSGREGLVMALVRERWKDAWDVVEYVERTAEQLGCALR